MSEHRLESEIGRILIERGLTLACAESCTGGLLMHRLTNVSGSSRYFRGGVVAYDNGVKHSVLGVQDNTLNVFGAVSEQVSAALARGVRAVIGSNIGIGVTGIAGPDGGTPEKPVGLVFISLCSADLTITKRFQFNGDRVANKEASVDAALKIVIDYLQNNV